MFRAVGVVGVGLLGGSLALALKQRGLAKKVVALTPGDYPPSQIEAEKAVQLGVVDATEPFADRIYRALPGVILKAYDAVIICTPVDQIAKYTLQIESYLPDDAFITDVGSVKASVVRMVEAPTHVSGRLALEIQKATAQGQSSRPNSRFLGSHPMAGSERSGVEAASAQLFAGRTCIITPTERNPLSLVERVTSFWEALGMTVLQLSPEQHDAVVGRTSHVPHVAASAIAAMLDESDRPFVGAGLKDTTRIAGGNADLWTAILKANKTAVLGGMARLRSELDAVVAALERDDELFLQQWLTNAKRVRDALGS